MAAKKPNGSVKVRVRELRNAKNLSLGDLMELTGLTRQYLNQLELGKCNPSRDTIALLCEAFDCPVESLIVYVENEDAQLSKTLVAA